MNPAIIRAQETIATLFDEIQRAADITIVYRADFVEAAATFFELDPQQYQRLHRRLKDKSVRVSAWERQVTGLARQQRTARERQERAAVAGNRCSPPIAPWQQPVDGAALLGELVDFLKRFIRLDEYQYVAVALWIVFTHCIDAADFATRHALLSPVKRCGKTRLLEMLALLCPRVIVSSNISPAAVYRTLDEQTSTLLIDEVDTFISRRSGLVGILNAGHSRSAAFVDRAQRRYSIFAPVAYAAIGKLPITWIDRSIEIRMRRKLRSEKVERLTAANTQALGMAQQLAGKARRWAEDNLDALCTSTVADVPELNDRAQNNWSLFFAIADRAGTVWGMKTRATAIALSRDDDQDDELAIQLLRDIRELTRKYRQIPSKVSSRDLVEQLNQLEFAPWATVTQGRPLTQAKLALLLRPFELFPRNDGTAHVFDTVPLVEVFSRYLPRVPQGVRASVPQRAVVRNGDSEVSAPDRSKTDFPLRQSRNIGPNRIRQPARGRSA